MNAQAPSSERPPPRSALARNTPSAPATPGSTWPHTWQLPAWPPWTGLPSRVLFPRNARGCSLGPEGLCPSILKTHFKAPPSLTPESPAPPCLCLPVAPRSAAYRSTSFAGFLLSQKASSRGQGFHPLLYLPSLAYSRGLDKHWAKNK